MKRRHRHEAISASAGSGKTFQLAHRYLWLLSEGVAPQAIVALTFSRKAAGEIFNSIVTYLLEAASIPEKARLTGERIGKPEFGRNDFMHLLKRLMAELKGLQIGTLDSFIIAALRAFALDLGLPPEFELFHEEGSAGLDAHRELLSTLFDHHQVSREEQDRLLNAFKEATFGLEEKGLTGNLLTFIGTYRDTYRALPRQEAWGQSASIWPEGAPWLEPVEDLGKAADDFKVFLENSGVPKSFKGKMKGVVDACLEYSDRAPWDKRLGSAIFQRLLAQSPGMERDGAVISYSRREYTFEASQGAQLHKLVSHVAGIELKKVLLKTRGIYRFLDLYERYYEEKIRSQGRLTFADTQYALAAASGEPGRGAGLTSQCDKEGGLFIGHRMGLELEHWLLDEFQDTSDLQWNVLSGLADEILKDETGRRSFFYVGDIKQAIYGWRGGNARLLGKILAQYQGLIEERPLDISFRSQAPVIEMVNGVFGELPEALLPAETVSDWNRLWRPHAWNRDAGVVKPAYAGVLEPIYSPDNGKPSEEDRYRLAASLLEEMQPLSRGLDVAVLAYTNRKVKEITHYLRQACKEMKIIQEGLAPLRENSVVSLFLSLVTYAAHPGDSLAWHHLRMSPLGRYLDERGHEGRDWPIKLLGEIENSGFRAFIRAWGERLNSSAPLDEFGKNRLDDLIAAAGEFDQNNERDCNAFLRFVNDYNTHESAAKNAVRVMTINQSKGLGFDVVLLPDLQPVKTKEGALRNGLLTGCDPSTDRADWVLKMPNRLIAEHEPLLSRHLQQGRARACFEELCKFYVALTRAKRGLYVITSYPGDNSKAITPAALLKQQLLGDPKPVEGPTATIGGRDFVCLLEIGEREWYRKVADRSSRKEASFPVEIPASFSQVPSRRRRLMRVSPSMVAGHKRNAGTLFSRDGRENLDLGTAVHALFEQVAWIEDIEVEAIMEQWLSGVFAESPVRRKSAEQFRQAVAFPQVRRALSRPEGKVDLWREKRFEVVLGNQWVSGVFDRVVIERDSTGRPVRATVLDYKSHALTGEEDLTPLVAHYRPQMALYGRALSGMTGLPSEAIKLSLLFTHTGKVCEVA